MSGGKLLLGAGVLAAAGAGAALAVHEGEPPPLDVPGFRFDRTMPPPGATISEPRGDRLSVVILMDREPDQPFNIVWGVELLASPSGPRCGQLAGTFAHAQRPLGLVLTSRVINGGPCGPVFDVTTLRIIALVDGVTATSRRWPRRSTSRSRGRAGRPLPVLAEGARHPDRAALQDHALG